MTTTHTTHLVPRTWGASEPYWDIDFDLKLVKNNLGRYEIRIVNGKVEQPVGYVFKAISGLWKSGLINSAYYPASADIMVRCTQHRHHQADSWANLEIVCHGETRRDWAIGEVLYQLVKRQAVATEWKVEQTRRPWIQSKADEGERWAIDHLREIDSMTGLSVHEAQPHRGYAINNRKGFPVSRVTSDSYPLTATCEGCLGAIYCADGTADWTHDVRAINGAYTGRSLV